MNEDKAGPSTYSMPLSLKRQIEAEAKERGWSPSFLVREAVKEWFIQQETRGRYHRVPSA